MQLHTDPERKIMTEREGGREGAGDAEDETLAGKGGRRRGSMKEGGEGTGRGLCRLCIRRSPPWNLKRPSERAWRMRFA